MSFETEPGPADDDERRARGQEVQVFLTEQLAAHGRDLTVVNHPAIHESLHAHRDHITMGDGSHDGAWASRVDPHMVIGAQIITKHRAMPFVPRWRLVQFNDSGSELYGRLLLGGLPGSGPVQGQVIAEVPGEDGVGGHNFLECHLRKTGDIATQCYWRPGSPMPDTVYGLLHDLGVPAAYLAQYPSPPHGDDESGRLSGDASGADGLTMGGRTSWGPELMHANAAANLLTYLEELRYE